MELWSQIDLRIPNTSYFKTIRGSIRAKGPEESVKVNTCFSDDGKVPKTTLLLGMTFPLREYFWITLKGYPLTDKKVIP